MGGETRGKFDRDFREGAVRLVRETGKPVAQVARDLGVNDGTLGNWVNTDRRRRDGGDGQLSKDERASSRRWSRPGCSPLGRPGRHPLARPAQCRLDHAHPVAGRGTHRHSDQARRAPAAGAVHVAVESGPGTNRCSQPLCSHRAHRGPAQPAGRLSPAIYATRPEQPGNMLQLGKVSRLLLAEPARQAPLLPDKDAVGVR